MGGVLEDSGVGGVSRVERGLSGGPVIYPISMKDLSAFDLPEFMLAHFGRVDFGGDLFGQWPVGIRFEIGIERVSRAAKIYEFAFASAQECVLASTDWTEGTEMSRRSTPLFETPGIFPSEPMQFQTAEVFPFDEAKYLLTWTRLSPLAYDAASMFQAIANREQPGDPKVNSRVFVIEPRSKIIMHMYDDRGLDVIAADIDTLRPMFESFSDWILENQRHRIEFRFRANSGEFHD